MALDSNTAFVNTDGAAFPDNKAVNATGPTTTDGTEFVKLLVDNYMFGPQQALLDHAGLTPDGNPEEAGASQELEAMQKSFSYPGEAVDWYGDQDPAVVGSRVLLLEGQGVLRANYSELDTAVYVGDVNNPTAPAFYHADDAAGTIRNTAGAYLILPDMRDAISSVSKQKFTSVVQNNGSASIISKTNDWIQSVNRTSLGTVSVTFKSGLFSVIPSVFATLKDTANQIGVSSITTTSCVVTTINSAGTAFVDNDFAIGVEFQDGDYNPLGDGFLQPGIRY